MTDQAEAIRYGTTARMQLESMAVNEPGRTDRHATRKARSGACRDEMGTRASG